jgi:hypothetical protein
MVDGILQRSRVLLESTRFWILLMAYTVTMEASTTLGHWQNDAFNPDNHAELYKDYVRAEGPSVLTLTIGGLTPNTVYTLRTFHWFGNPGIIGSLTLTPVNETVGDQSSYTANYDGSVFPESLDDFSVLMTLTSNSSGEISIESNGGSWGTYTNVLNGFVLSAVPEPSTASLAIGVGALLGLGRRRRRESIR